LFVCESLCQTAESQSVLARLAGDAVTQVQRFDVWHVTPQVFAKLAFGERAEGVVAVAVAREKSLAEMTLPASPLVAVLAGVEKPGNIGAVLRSADGAGIDALIVVDGGTDLYNPNTIRASLGTIFNIPVCVAAADETLDWLRAHGMRIFAARLDAALDYTTANFTGPTAIVLGSEAAGLDAVWSADDVVPIRLPMLCIADSLNVSASAAVLFYEALRQRGERAVSDD
jgi:TrmH family RNA methyltransferase